VVELPDDAIKAAACAISGYSPAQYERWRHTSKGEQHHDRAVAALTAAYPFIAARVRAEVVAEQTDVYELRERGIRVLGEEQCCELACNDGACETCPCCSAGWCVWGHSSEVPSRDLTPMSDYRRWLAQAAEHNPVAKQLAHLEGVADADYDEDAQTPPEVAEAIAAERQRTVEWALSKALDETAVPGESWFEAGPGESGPECIVRFLQALVTEAAGSVPVATPPTCKHGIDHAHDTRPTPWEWGTCPGPVATPTEPGEEAKHEHTRGPDGSCTTCSAGPVDEDALAELNAAFARPVSASPVPAEQPPTFEQLLTDPMEQFDTRSELLPAILHYLAQPDPPDSAREALLRSIEEYRNAPSATASTLHMTRPAEQPEER